MSRSLIARRRWRIHVGQIVGWCTGARHSRKRQVAGATVALGHAGRGRDLRGHDSQTLAIRLPGNEEGE
jgi:hypothetical protein